MERRSLRRTSPPGSLAKLQAEHGKASELPHTLSRNAGLRDCRAGTGDTSRRNLQPVWPSIRWRELIRSEREGSSLDGGRAGSSRLLTSEGYLHRDRASHARAVDRLDAYVS